MCLFVLFGCDGVKIFGLKIFWIIPISEDERTDKTD